jgi:hypothetical protein
VLAASAGAGTVAIASAQLHRNEPQALRLLGNGDLAVDIADGPIWLTSRQGLYATVAVAALPARAQRGGLDRLVWAPLNRPLHAWPSGGWFAQSQVAGELPDATLPAAWADYGGHVTVVINKTYAEIDRSGLTGLTSFGLYPRYWGTEMGEEVDCPVGQDPTPQDDKDDTFWCATWTDYHNTAATTVARAMQTGQVEWLDDLATPAALRMLHTQIHQCSPADTWFYCGQAPSGYGGYRADFNSSHAYFKILFLYYWLTGDATVPYETGVFGGVQSPGAVDSVTAWATKNGCTGARAAAGMKDLDAAQPGAESTAEATAGCPAGGAADLWTIPNGSHIPSLATTFPDDLTAWLAANHR